MIFILTCFSFKKYRQYYACNNYYKAYAEMQQISADGGIVFVRPGIIRIAVHIGRIAAKVRFPAVCVGRHHAVGIAVCNRVGRRGDFGFPEILVFSVKTAVGASVIHRTHNAYVY